MQRRILSIAASHPVNRFLHLRDVAFQTSSARLRNARPVALELLDDHTWHHKSQDALPHHVLHHEQKRRLLWVLRHVEPHAGINKHVEQSTLQDLFLGHVGQPDSGKCDSGANCF